MIKTVLDIFKKKYPHFPWDETPYDYRLLSPVSLDDFPGLTLYISWKKESRHLLSVTFAHLDVSVVVPTEVKK